MTEQKYDDAVVKLKDLLTKLPEKSSAPLDQLYFTVALAQLLGGHPAEAEAAFTECLKKFPKGDYASRCYLGAGRAAMLQDSKEKKELAAEALKLAAQDPKFRSEAGLWLGQVYTDLGQRDEALKVFRSLMGSDIRSPQQTTAAVEVIGLLADTGKNDDLVYYLDRLINQSGVRDSLAWYANQVISKADAFVGTQSYEPALAIYRSVPPRSEILDIQKRALESQTRDVEILERRVAAEKSKNLGQRSNAAELLGSLKPAVALATEALKGIEEKTDLDAALLMRRGRCLYYLDRAGEALVCFRTIRTKYPESSDAQPAAYAEIVLLNKLKDIPQIKKLCDLYLTKYPKAENAEQIATLAGEVLVQSGKWDEVFNFYRDLEKKFPQSESLPRFIFFQGVAKFQDADFKTSTPLFVKFLKKYNESPLAENALYYLAMSNFLSNEYKKTLGSIKEYLTRFPDGRYAGDMRYRLAFIDFNDKEDDQTDKIIRDLTAYLNKKPDDLAAGSMYCLLGDTYKKKTSNKADENARNEKLAIDAYKKAIATESPDDVKQYALDSATSLLQGNKDWAGIGALHGDFLKNYPDNPLALLSASWVAKALARDGKSDQAAEMLAKALKPKIGDPSSEQVELLIDELVKLIVPRRKPKDLDKDALDKKLVEMMNKAIKGSENATTNARLYYARARLSELLRDRKQADLYLQGIATINAKDPSVLSPALLATSGDILLKLGDLDGAEGMYNRLSDRYKEGNYADAGPVGLGYVALAKENPEKAYKIFENALETNPGMSRFKETTLGKLQAESALGRLEEAEKLALEIVGDRVFRGDAVGKAYILLGEVYRKQAEKVSTDDQLELLKKAYATYQRVYIAYRGYPEVCARAYYEAWQTAQKLGNSELAENTLKALLDDPKLAETEYRKKAAKEAA